VIVAGNEHDVGGGVGDADDAVGCDGEARGHRIEAIAGVGPAPLRCASGYCAQEKAEAFPVQSQESKIVASDLTTVNAHFN